MCQRVQADGEVVPRMTCDCSERSAPVCAFWRPPPGRAPMPAPVLEAVSQVVCPAGDTGGARPNRQRMGVYKPSVQRQAEYPRLVEAAAVQLGLRPDTPRHNGKAERSHREDQKRLYACYRFDPPDDVAKPSAVHNRPNDFPYGCQLFLLLIIFFHGCVLTENVNLL